MKLPFWPDPKGYRDIDLGLKRVYELLERLGSPHLKIPPTIHSAGTNGKGSTLAFLRSIFQEANLSTHVYTSPHLVNFNERIILANKEIADDFLNEILLECKNAAEKFPKIEVTFFEGITVAAFLAFSKVKADMLLLETGMGGRLDATNVLTEVLCSIITPISFDHTEFLGKTLDKIAIEKAGIIKKNCPVFIAKQENSALQAIEEVAKNLNCETKVFDSDFFAKLNDKNWIYKDLQNEIELENPQLLGSHQFENAAVAVAVVLAQKKFSITNNQIKSGIAKAFWPARLQKINSGKFSEILPKNFELYLDGSHNPQGATTIKNFLKSQKNKKILVIFSMVNDKDCEGFLSEISPEIDYLISLAIPDEPRSRSALEIKNIAKKIGIKSDSARDFEEAFEKAKLLEKEPTLVLICGSLYLAGSFLFQNYNEKNH